VNVRTSWRWLGAIILLITASEAGAQPPSPLDVARLYAFPGALPGPASAVSAGRGLSDRWLGEEPFDNPAAAPARGVTVAPVLLRVKRQDLPADYRNYDESAGFLDVAGGCLSLPVRGIGVALYAYEPVLRREDAAFTSKPDEVPAGTFTTASSARELRAGLALSHAWRAARFGAALEWTRRDDSYDFKETSGNPFAGERHVDFSGDGFGFQAGARGEVVPHVTLGGALRYVPALDLSGEQDFQALGIAGPVSATREAGWEGGLSARVAVTEAFRVLASLGGRTAQAWDGFDVTSGRAVSWGVGLDYDEAEVPWTLRFGLGQEQQAGVPEPRAGVIGLGLGWKLDELRLDAGVLRRSIERAGKATSYDDRVVASATVGF
jgi:hypothetical protein